MIPDSPSNSKSLIRINDKIRLRTSGDVSKIPSNDQLFQKGFLQFNNHLITKSYNSNQDILTNILNQIPGFTSIISSLDKSGRYVVDLTKEQAEKLNNGEWEFTKAKNGSGYRAILRNAEDKNFKKQVFIKPEDISQAQMQNLLNATQMLMIQQAIQKVSSQLEALDEKVSDVLHGAQNDRLAYIQSGYNLFLQAQASESLKNSLYPIMIGQLNLGREQLIYSLQHSLSRISESKQGAAAFLEGFTKWGDQVKANEERLNGMKQSLSFIIRSTQLLAIIYQDQNEHWSMMQSISRLQEVLEHFKEEDMETLSEWVADPEEIYDFRKAIVGTKNAIKKNIKTLMESPSDFKLQLQTEIYE